MLGTGWNHPAGIYRPRRGNRHHAKPRSGRAGSAHTSPMENCPRASQGSSLPSETSHGPLALRGLTTRQGGCGWLHLAPMKPESLLGSHSPAPTLTGLGLPPGTSQEASRASKASTKRKSSSSVSCCIIPASPSVCCSTRRSIRGIPSPESQPVPPVPQHSHRVHVPLCKTGTEAKILRSGALLSTKANGARGFPRLG